MTVWNRVRPAGTALAVSGVLGLMLALAPASTEAATITINSTTPSWSNTVGGTGVNTSNTGSGNGTVFDVHWGTSQGSGQSGLGFDPSNPPISNVPTDTVFKIGDLFHYNNPISSGTAATSTQLDLSTVVAGAAPGTQLFSFKFLINETPNVLPCQFPSTTPCADQITFQNLTTLSSFTVGGNSYTLQLEGFSTNGGTTITNNFISQEGGTNSAGLYGIITAPHPVPEPATMAVLGAGLVGLGLARRRSNR